jgi:hypothetical protein
MKILFLISILAAPGDDAFQDENPEVINFEELSDIEGIQIENSKSGHYGIRGKIHRASDRIRLKKFIDAHPSVEDKTELSQSARLSVLDKLSKLAPRAKFSSKGSVIYVTNLSPPALLEELRGIYPDIRVLGTKTQNPKSEASISLEVALIEVKKTALEAFGPRLSSPLSATFSTKTRFGVDPVRLFLDLALRKGEARVHAKQSLVTQNGKQGEFQIGGEFPIRVSGRESGSVVFKEYGLILKFTPRLEGEKSVHLDIISEMSDVDMENAVENVPALRKKLLKTQVFANLGEMMAIGGLIRADQAKASSGIPGLSEIPGLGRLFRSDAFRKEKSEAYIFITPVKMDSPWIPSPRL